MPINWSDIPLMPVGLLAALAFLASLIGHTLARNPLVGAILTTIVFLAVYIFWEYYPHGLLPTLHFPRRV